MAPATYPSLARQLDPSVRWSETQIRSVGGRILDDLHLVVGRRLLQQDAVLGWYEVVRLLLANHAAERLELQLRPPGALPVGLRYVVVDGGPYTDAPSGGFDLYPFPSDTRVSIVAGYLQAHPQLSIIRQEVSRLGWTESGSFLDGPATQDRTYLEGAVGVVRQRVGTWP